MNNIYAYSIFENVHVTRDRVPIHVVNEVDEAQHDNGDFLPAGDCQWARGLWLGIHQVLL